MKTAMMTIMITVTMIMIEIIVIICSDDEGGNADENNGCDCSHGGKRAERAMLKVRYCPLSLRLL